MRPRPLTGIAALAPIWLAVAAFPVLASGPADAVAASVPSPESVLGFEPGADRKLADWNQIVDYFQQLDAASARVRTEIVGKTTEGRPFLVVTITSEANQARLEEIRQANLRLAEPRGLDPAEAERLIASGKAIVSLNHGIHASEVGPPQASMTTAWRLATAEGELARALDDVVVLMLPSHNPDGTQQVVEWYRKTLGTAFEGAGCDTGCRLPFLYHHYAGHDNNRDWYAFSLQESRLTVAQVYDRWRPQIVHDLHQMGARGARLFLPPYLDPWEPNVDPALTSAVNALGSQVAAELTSSGKSGIVTNGIFDAWTPSRAYPHTHGGVRLLSEMASAAFATPVEIDPASLRPGLGYDARERSWNQPWPWAGGRWALSDIVSYDLAANLAVVRHAASNREFWLRTMYGSLKRAAERTDPYAFVLPSPARDPYASSELVRILRTGAVEVDRASEPFQAGDRRFEAGSLVIRMQQPFSSFAKTLLERQQYPDRRQYPGGPPIAPYDVTAHTLPLLLGVEAVAVKQPFEAALERLSSSEPAPGRVESGGPLLALEHRSGDLSALASLLSRKVKVSWALQPFEDRGRRFEAGTLLVTAAARAQVESFAASKGISARAVDRLPPSARTLQLARAPRIGLYQSWRASMDEGWTRYAFEQQLGLPYQTLHDDQIRRGDLRAKFDAIVLPDQPAAQIRTGFAPGELPDPYTGGLGDTGIQALRSFVEEGGTLVALNQATAFAISDLKLPVRNVMADEKKESFYCPGALLRATVSEPSSPLTHGLDSSASVWFEASPAFAIDGGRALLRYGSEDPLLSGWLLGGSKLSGQAALVEVPLGQGRVVLFGFRPQYRAQSWSTYPALLNALFLSVASPALWSPPTAAARPRPVDRPGATTAG